MARDEVRVACVLSACILAGAAGVLWGQEDVPPSGEEQREADEAEVEADAVEHAAEGAEGILPEINNEGLEAWARESELEAREAEAEVPVGG